MEISTVTSVYRLEDLNIIKTFIEKIELQIQKNKIKDYEIIFVIDEESDKAFNFLVKLKNENKKIKVINLSKNFGHHEALLTGIEFSSGQYVFVIDCDLEEDPSIFTDFYKEILDNDIDLVLGYLKKRKGNYFEKISGSVFYFYINKILKINYPKNPTTASLMTERFKNALLLHTERNINYVGLLKETGFQKKLIQVDKKSLRKSTYNLRRKINHLVNIVFSHSDMSFSLIFYISILNFILSLGFVIYSLVRYFQSNVLEGYTSILISIWFFSSIIILLLGIMSFYLKLILRESKTRPRSIIKNIL